MPPGPIWGPFWVIFSISQLVGNFGLLVGSVGWLVALLGWFSRFIGAWLGFWLELGWLVELVGCFDGLSRLGQVGCLVIWDYLGWLVGLVSGWGCWLGWFLDCLCGALPRRGNASSAP